MTAPVSPDAGGLREAVEALLAANERTAPGDDGAVDRGIDAADRAWRADLRALLAAHPAPEADPTAGEREPCTCPPDEFLSPSDCALHGDSGHRPECYCPPANVGDGVKPQPDCPVHGIAPTTPDAGDASEREQCASSHDGHPCGQCDGPGDAGTSASEPLSEDVEALGDLIAGARDEYPRVADDMDSEELAHRILASDWLADVRRAAAEAAWGEAVQALAWSIDHGNVHDAMPYVAANNPYRAARLEADR